MKILKFVWNLFYDLLRCFIKYWEKIKNVLFFFKTYDVGYKGKVTGVIYFLGVIFISLIDNIIKVLEFNLSFVVIIIINDYIVLVIRVNRLNIYMWIVRLNFEW